MTDPLAGVEAKIKRGFDHLDEFERDARTFLDEGPYTIVHERDADGWGHYGVFHVVKNPPLTLGIVAGEAIGQFRSALDHLMTEVIRLRRPTLGHSENFPIYSNETYRARSSTGSASPRERFRRLIKPEHLAILDGLQPKLQSGEPAWPGGPRRGLLLVMQWLTNMDKHELIHPVFAAPSRIVYHSYPYVRYWSRGIETPLVIEEGTQLYHVQFADEAEMHMPLELDIDLALGPPPMMRITLREMRHFGARARAIVRDFRVVTPEFAPEPPAHGATSRDA